jgi:hypothetical protein
MVPLADMLNHCGGSDGVAETDWLRPRSRKQKK